MYYEVLFIEEGIYYISYYENNQDRPVSLRIEKDAYESWRHGKEER